MHSIVVDLEREGLVESVGPAGWRLTERFEAEFGQAFREAFARESAA